MSRTVVPERLVWGEDQKLGRDASEGAERNTQPQVDCITYDVACEQI